MSIKLSKVDHLISGIDRILRGFTDQVTGTVRVNPANGMAPTELTPAEQRQSAGLMRVNHTGEVAAQALYLGQALVARTATSRQSLLQAAKEEQDHLLWCGQRLYELQARTSYLNPLWFVGSLAIGVMAGLYDDAYSLGFVVETEQQVEAHLTQHLQQLPANDHASMVILQQMRLDERQHGEQAQQQGAKSLPTVVKWLMRIPAKLMTNVAYYV